MTTTPTGQQLPTRRCCPTLYVEQHSEVCLAGPPQPVPLSPADRCEPAGASLLAAGDELRALCAVDPGGWPAELRRRYDRVDRGALYAVAEWLTARAGLYGVTPAQPDEAAGFVEPEPSDAELGVQP